VAIVVESVASAESASTTSLSCNAPTGVANGDLLLAILCGSPSWNEPAGWTTIYDRFDGAFGGGYAWYKIASSEGASYAFTRGAADSISVAILRISGHDATSPINANNAGIDTEYDATFTCDGVTSTVNNCLIVASVMRISNFLVSSISAGWDSRFYSAGTGYSLGVGSKILVSAGASGTMTMASSSLERSAWMAFSIAPAAAAGGKPWNYYAQAQ
jgi:hypothetical protein